MGILLPLKSVLGMVIICVRIPLVPEKGHHQVSEYTKLVMLLHRRLPLNQSVCMAHELSFRMWKNNLRTTWSRINLLVALYPLRIFFSV